MLIAYLTVLFDKFDGSAPVLALTFAMSHAVRVLLQKNQLRGKTPAVTDPVLQSISLALTITFE